MRVVTIKIEKLAFGGNGLGYVDGKVCFIPFSAPGDLLRIKVTSEKRSYMEGEILEVLEPSSQRTIPACPVFSICGGCNWQHLPYMTQLSEKQKIYSDIIWRSGRVESHLILPIIPAPSPFGYRSRVQFKVRSVAGEIHLGFFKPGSHYVVNVPGICAIVDSSINRLVPELLRMLRVFPEPDKVPQIDISIGGEGNAAVIFHYIGSNIAETIEFMEKNRTILASSGGLYIQSGRKMTMRKIDGPKLHGYLVSLGDAPGSLESRLTFTPGGFSQVNYRQNNALVATVHDWCGLTGKESLLDIYCGNGNISIPLAAKCREIVGIEEYESSIKDAHYNSQLNGLVNTRFICNDAVRGIKNSIDRKEEFDIVVLDPPRAGAAEIAHLIPSLKPEKIIYISCDPPTLARDIGILKGYGYEVIKCQPIDMFPQTFHIESVTLLVPTYKSMQF